MKYTYNTRDSYDPTQSRKERIDHTSKTVLYPVLSVRQILERYKNGLNPNQKNGIYDTDADFDSIDFEKTSKMDISEQRALSEEIFQDISSKKEKLNYLKSKKDNKDGVKPPTDKKE